MQANLTTLVFELAQSGRHVNLEEIKYGRKLKATMLTLSAGHYSATN